MDKAPQESAAFVKVIQLDQCPPNRPVFIEVGDRELVLVRMGDSDEVLCLDNRCPHAGAGLSGGHVDDLHLVCPQHHWKFHLRTGGCEGTSHVGVARYDTCIEDGTVFVRPVPIAFFPPLGD